MKSTKLPEKSYLGSREIDALARMQTELLSELWILRDRVTVLEHLLEQADVLQPDQIDDFTPPTELEAKLLSERDKLVARVVGAGQRTEISVEAIKAAENSS